MSTPNESVVNAAALAAKLAIKTEANSAWILNADTIIAEMAARGKFSVTLPVPKPASMHDLSIYYRNLNYGFWFGQCQGWVGDFSNPWGGGFNPNYNWGSSFYSYFYTCNCKEVCNVIISWRTPV